MLKDFQFKQMLGLQDKLNSLINPDWKVAGNNWLLAGAMELSECIEHYGWKWWKYTSQNIVLAQNEIVDYFHFILSHSIIESSHLGYKTPLDVLSECKGELVLNFDLSSYAIYHMSTQNKLFLLIGISSARRVHFELLNLIMQDLGLTWEDVYKQYVSKNLLNIFRQENGYQQDTYFKNWYDGREDNEHMMDVLHEFEPLFYTEDFLTVLELELKKRYAITVEKSQANFAAVEEKAMQMNLIETVDEDPDLTNR